MKQLGKFSLGSITKFNVKSGVLVLYHYLKLVLEHRIPDFSSISFNGLGEQTSMDSFRLKKLTFLMVSFQKTKQYYYPIVVHFQRPKNFADDISVICLTKFVSNNIIYLPVNL